MQIKTIREEFRNFLKDEYPLTEIDSFFYILTEAKLGKQRVDIAIQPYLELDEQQLQYFRSALVQLKDHVPVQYITGKTEFRSKIFKVNENVLIPRPETEELVQWILDDLKNREASIDILDIGTGSGCIAVSLASEIKNSNVTAYDISQDTLKVALSNAEINEVEVKFVRKDILEQKSLSNTFDIIVSNPPYVRELEKAAMANNVLLYEPKGALYVKDTDPLLFYRKISELALTGLKKNGVLYFEINQYLGEETAQLMEQMGFVVELRKDMYGNDRMIKAWIK